MTALVPQTRRAWPALRGGEGGQRFDLAGRESALLVVAGQTVGLMGKALEDVVDERVQDGHSALADAGVGVHLLEDLVDVGAVALNSLLGLALASGLLGVLAAFFSNAWGLAIFII